MKHYLRSILLAIMVIVADYGLILIMRVITPEILWLRSVIIYVIFQVSLFIYYLLINPKNLKRFTGILLLVFSAVTVLLTLLQHVVISKDLNINHALPLILIIASILISYRVYQGITK